MKIDLQKILQYLEGTTEESWCTDVVKTTEGKNCFFGHLFDFGGPELYSSFENIATEYMIYPVNDGKCEMYQQSTPKQRCIAYLKDLISGKQKTTWQLMDEGMEEINKNREIINNKLLK